ncbi:serine/threonine-protein phosphatase, partial [Actinomadura montaniterrae]
MAHLSLRYAAGTDIGRRRRVNEDSALAGPSLLAVADGMGGHPHGDVASAAAVTALAE